MAAFFGFPENGKKLPALLQIHAGGQSASLMEVEFYAKRGYACLSINWGGREMEEAQDGDPKILLATDADFGMKGRYTVRSAWAVDLARDVYACDPENYRISMHHLATVDAIGLGRKYQETAIFSMSGLRGNLYS